MAGKEKVIMAALVLAYLVSIHGRNSVLAEEVVLVPGFDYEGVYRNAEIVKRAIKNLKYEIEQSAGKGFLSVKLSDYRRLKDGDTSVIVRAQSNRADVSYWQEREWLKIKATIDFLERKEPFLREVLVDCAPFSKP